MEMRKLGATGIEVSAMGLGCWAIGGHYTHGGKAVGWGEVDDSESVRAIHRGIDLGVTFFDTAACYGAGHSEKVLGEALKGKRDGVVVATKFGHLFDPEKRESLGDDTSPDNLARSCEASLKRLKTDHIDVLQFHCNNADIAVADDLVPALERLVEQGKIRCYGWSTDDPARAESFVKGDHCGVVQLHFNILEGNVETLRTAEKHGLAAIIRGPLGKGLLTGKFKKGDKLSGDDVRSGWDTESGDLARAIDLTEEIRGILTEDGRTLAQGAIGWLWALSPATIPIPGFKSVAQVEDNVGALKRGPLSRNQMARIDDCLCKADWVRGRFV